MIISTHKYWFEWKELGFCKTNYNQSLMMSWNCESSMKGESRSRIIISPQNGHSPGREGLLFTKWLILKTTRFEDGEIRGCEREKDRYRDIEKRLGWCVRKSWEEDVCKWDTVCKDIETDIDRERPRMLKRQANKEADKELKNGKN